MIMNHMATAGVVVDVVAEEYIGVTEAKSFCGYECHKMYYRLSKFSKVVSFTISWGFDNIPFFPGSGSIDDSFFDRLVETFDEAPKFTDGPVKGFLVPIGGGGDEIKGNYSFGCSRTRCTRLYTDNTQFLTTEDT